MGKKFGVKNLVGAMMALTTMNVGSAVSHAKEAEGPQPQHSSQVESIELFGGDFVKNKGKQVNVMGRKSARTLVKTLIEQEVLGAKKDILSKDGDVGLRVVENTLYRAAVRGCSRDCIGVGEDAVDKRNYLARKLSDANPDEDLEFPILKDEAAIAAVKENFPKVLDLVRLCFVTIQSLGKENPSGATSLVTGSDLFSATVSCLDEILRCFPSVTEAALRLVIRDIFFGNSLENSLLGKNFELDVHSADILKYVKPGFDKLKEKWDNRTTPLVSTVTKTIKNVTADYLMYGKSGKKTKTKR